MHSVQILTLLALAIGAALYWLRCRQEARLLDNARPVPFSGWLTGCLALVFNLIIPKSPDGLAIGFAGGYIIVLALQYSRRVRELRRNSEETATHA